MDPLLLRLILAIIVFPPLALLLVRTKSLTKPAILVAGALGLYLFIASPLFLILLLFFLASSSLLEKIKQNEDQKKADEITEKTGKRDSWQVLANAIIPLFWVIFIQIQSAEFIQDLTLTQVPALCAFLSSISAATADTWATEIGVKSGSTPRLLMNPKKKVTPGTSGGITLFGTLGGVAGISAIIAIYLFTTFVFSIESEESLSLSTITLHVLFIFVGGITGLFADSLLGSWIQAQYYCPVCMRHSEKKQHPACLPTNDQPLKKIKGQIIVTNDVVNLLSISIASIITFISLILLS